MRLQKLDRNFTVCQIPAITHVDGEFVFMSKTDDEISLVCESMYIPANVIVAEHNWKGLKIATVLDFGMIGVIAKISNILAQVGISLFVVSTYNTDYVFVKEKSFTMAIRVLMDSGYNVQ